jgi:hypothetical protein
MAMNGAMRQAGPGKASCWCFWVEMPASLRVLAHGGGRSCICHGCVAAEKRAEPWNAAAGNGEFYRLDDGRIVFTERYHLRRGYCCGNGCRHCPYDGDGRPRRDVLEAIAP